MEVHLSQILFLYIRRHILLRSDILPVSALCFRKKCSAGDLQHGHALHTKMTCEGTQEAGFGWITAKTQWNQNSNLKLEKKWICPWSSTTESTHRKPCVYLSHGVKRTTRILNLTGYFSSDMSQEGNPKETKRMLLTENKSVASLKKTKPTKILLNCGQF